MCNGANVEAGGRGFLLSASQERFVTLKVDNLSAAIDTYNGSLVQLTDNGVRFCPERNEKERAANFHGSVLLPFVNRIANGRYDFAGRNHQLEINEPGRSAALHGLAGRALWHKTDVSESLCSLNLLIESFPGYPFKIEATTHYNLQSSGLHIEWFVTNFGKKNAPLGLGFHPSFRLGDGVPQSWELTMSAKKKMDVDSASLLPTGLVSVEGTAYDFRSGAHPRHVLYDHAFTDLEIEETAHGPCHRAEVRHPLGNSIELTWSPSLPWLHLHIPALQTKGGENIVLEPQTSPPDAFNSGHGLVVLEPGETFQGWVHIRVLSGG